MRKLILSMMVSADGYTEDRDPALFWHHWDEEMDAYMMDFFDRVDTFVYGRRAYQDMIAYWPQLDDPFARVMNSMPKLVFSRTLDTATWNATLCGTDPAEEIRRRKQLPGKDMVLFAGPILAEPLIRANLVDEYRLITNPVVLGGGAPLFRHVSGPLYLHIVETKAFTCGNVLLVYRPVSGAIALTAEQ